MPRPEIEAVMQRNWSPVELEGEAIPQWMEGLPSTLVHSVYASRSPIPGLSYSDSDVVSADLMGSIEVYRYSPDDPVALNRDWYPIITFGSSDSMLLSLEPFAVLRMHRPGQSSVGSCAILALAGRAAPWPSLAATPG